MRSYTLPTLAKGYKFAINNCAAINLGMKWNIVIKWRKSSEIICMWMRAESFQEMKWENWQELSLMAYY